MQKVLTTQSQIHKSALAVKSVHKKYNPGRENEVYVLKGIDFKVPYGQMVAVMGPSGCGKTTLLNLIGGLDGITEGTVEIDGEAIDELSDSQLTAFRRDKIGYIFQLFNLFQDQTSLENVILPLLLQKANLKDAISEAKMMLQEVGLGDRYNDKPGKLSGGEQQKVAISRALITRPRIILADEPTGDLDIATSDDIMSLFRRMQEENPGLSIVIVTHSRRIAEQCDRIIHISDGQITLDEDLKEVS